MCTVLDMQHLPSHGLMLLRQNDEFPFVVSMTISNIVMTLNVCGYLCIVFLVVNLIIGKLIKSQLNLYYIIQFTNSIDWSPIVDRLIHKLTNLPYSFMTDMTSITHVVDLPATNHPSPSAIVVGNCMSSSWVQKASHKAISTMIYHCHHDCQQTHI